MFLFLTTNMAAVTSRANQQLRVNFSTRIFFLSIHVWLSHVFDCSWNCYSFSFYSANSVVTNHNGLRKFCVEES